MAAVDADVLLTLDRGNSTLDCLRTGSGAPERRRLDPDDQAGLRALLAPQRPRLAVGATVVPRGLERARALLARHGIPLLLAGEDLRCPLELRYAEPAALGVDRWLGALAAQRLYGDAVVVDCGTALTVNLVSARGVFLGGAIAPGATTMALALQERAPRLPAADLEREVQGVPVTTLAAVSLGVGLAFHGAVARLVAHLTAEAGMSGAARVITGGDAERYLRHGASGFVHVPDLVHRGLRELLAAARIGDG